MLLTWQRFQNIKPGLARLDDVSNAQNDNVKVDSVKIYTQIASNVVHYYFFSNGYQSGYLSNDWLNCNTETSMFESNRCL